jgi:hypothetical protein
MNAITKPQTHADAAAATLRQALAASHAPLRDAVATYRTAIAALTPDADLLDALRAAGNIALAAEAIATAGKDAEAGGADAGALLMHDLIPLGAALPGDLTTAEIDATMAYAEAEKALATRAAATSPPGAL